MFLMKTYDAQKAVATFFKGFSISGLVTAFICLFSISGLNNLPSVMAAVIFLATTSFLALFPRFQARGLSLLLCYFTFMFLYVPTGFLITMGADYDFSTGLRAIPNPNFEYHQNLPGAYLFLTICWAAVWLALVKAPRERAPDNVYWLQEPKIFKVLCLALLVGVVTHFANQVLLVAAWQESAVSVVPRVLGFFLFDHAAMVVIGLLLLKFLNGENRHFSQRFLTLTFEIAFVVFVLVFTLAASRAGILHVFNFLILLPVVITLGGELGQQGSRVVFFRPAAIFSTLILVPIIFIGAFLYRDFMAGRVEETFLTALLELLAEEGANHLIGILYRLSAGGLNAYMMLYESFIVPTEMISTRFEYLTYVVKNAINLVLPGTIFPETYGPSSNLFEELIAGDPLDGRHENFADLWRSLNTQPLTIFGLPIILSAMFAPLTILVLVYLFQTGYHILRPIPVRAALAYFFFCILSSFGVELVIANSIQFLISFLVLMTLMKLTLRLPSGISKHPVRQG